MKKQNRFLFVIFGFVLIVLTVVFFRAGIFSTPSDAPAIDDTNENLTGSEPNQESMGEPLKETSIEETAKLEEMKVFQQIMTDLGVCFSLPAVKPDTPVPVTIESIIQLVQTDLGPASVQSDRWMKWHLRNKDQGERRLHLEISSDDDGKKHRQLKYFAVDKEGNPIPIELPPERAQNPSDEAINQMLKEGDVFYKEKSAFVEFPGREHLEYVEKNGTLSEIEFQKGDVYFRCQSFKTKESCQCVH